MRPWSPPAGPPPRLRLAPTGSHRALLDGGWWPRSRDPAAELPGLVLAIDALHGPVTRLAVSVTDWDARVRRVQVAGRVLRLGYFASQPTNLLTARCDNGDRVDLLVVPPGTGRRSAEAAMALAAWAGNRVPAQCLVAAGGRRADADEARSEQEWESEGGRLRGPPPPFGHDAATGRQPETSPV